MSRIVAWPAPAWPRRTFNMTTSGNPDMHAAKAHRFRIQLERIGDDTSAALSFEVSNHDDIFAIVDRVRTGTAFGENDAIALAVGLKLFTGVMLTARHDPLFADIQPAMRTFIGNLKSRIAATTAQSHKP